MFQEDINLVRQIVAEEIAKALASLKKPVVSVPAAPEPKVEPEKEPVKKASQKP